MRNETTLQRLARYSETFLITLACLLGFVAASPLFAVALAIVWMIPATIFGFTTEPAAWLLELGSTCYGLLS